MILKKMDKLFLKIFGQELFNVFIVELIMILTVGLIFFLILVVLYAVSWLWKIGIVLAIVFGVKIRQIAIEVKIRHEKKSTLSLRIY